LIRTEPASQFDQIAFNLYPIYLGQNKTAGFCGAQRQHGFALSETANQAVGQYIAVKKQPRRPRLHLRFFFESFG
jgi:hypothetical protein